jgi:hypothetical protein
MKMKKAADLWECRGDFPWKEVVYGGEENDTIKNISPYFFTRGCK